MKTLNEENAIKLISKLILNLPYETVKTMGYFCIDIENKDMFDDFVKFLNQTKYEGQPFPFETGEEGGIPHVKIVKPIHFVMGYTMFDNLYNYGNITYGNHEYEKFFEE